MINSVIIAIYRPYGQGGVSKHTSFQVSSRHVLVTFPGGTRLFQYKITQNATYSIQKGAFLY